MKKLFSTAAPVRDTKLTAKTSLNPSGVCFDAESFIRRENLLKTAVKYFAMTSHIPTGNRGFNRVLHCVTLKYLSVKTMDFLVRV